MRDGWQHVTLGEVVELDVEKEKVAEDTLYRFASVASFGRGLFARDELKGNEFSYTTLHRLRRGQFVMSRLFAWEGAMAVVDDAFHGFYLSPEFPTFTPGPEVELGYLRLVTDRPGFWSALRPDGMGGRRIRVKADTFLSAEIPLPPVQAQRRIVDLIAHVDEATEAAEKATRKSVAAGRAIRSSALTGAATVAPLADFAEVRMGRQRSPKNHAGDSMVPYLRSANVKDNRLELDDVKAMNFTKNEQEVFALRKGDVLVTEGSGSIEEVGASAAWGEEIPGPVMFQNTLIRLRPLDERTSSEYLLELARWAYESGRWLDVASGTNIKHIGSRRAAAAEMPLLAREDQRHLVLLSAAIARNSATARATVGALRQLREGLVASLLSGDHDIPDGYDTFLEAVGQ